MSDAIMMAQSGSFNLPSEVENEGLTSPPAHNPKQTNIPKQSGMVDGTFDTGKAYIN